MNGKQVSIGACILACDMKLMVPFYRDILGFHADWDGGDFAEFETACGPTSFFMYSRQQFAKTIRCDYVPAKGLNQTFEIALWLPCFDDVDREYERLSKLSVTFPCGAPVTYDFGIRNFYVADPEGNLLEIGSQNKVLTLKSDRLTMSPMTADELRATIAAQESPKLRQAFQEMLDNCTALPEHHRWYAPWKIALSDRPDEVIGELGFHGPAVNGEVEISYGLQPGFEGHGYMTEAVRTVIQWTFSQPGIATVVAETAPDNAASQKILSRLGFHQYGTGEEGPRFRKDKV